MINHDAATPVYLQIRNQIKQDIAAQIYRNGDKLPSEREMCEKYAVSRIPVRKALEMLEAEGLVHSVHGKGTFVKEPVINDSLFQISTFSETLAQKGYAGYTKIISFEEHTPDSAYDIVLDSAVNGTSQLKLLGYANAVPVVFYDCVIKRPVSLEFYEAAQACEKAGIAFSTFDLYTQTKITIGKINQRVLAINAGQEIAGKLSIPEGTAVLVLETVILDTDMKPIEFKRGYYRTDKYSFTLHRTL